LREADNYGFLIALASHPKADPLLMQMAISRALELRGPSAAYRDLARRYQSSRWLLSLKPHKIVRARTQMRNVWVSGVDSDPVDFGLDRSRQVLEEMAVRIRAGGKFQAILEEYSKRYPARAGGSHIGYYGVFVAPDTGDVPGVVEQV